MFVVGAYAPNPWLAIFLHHTPIQASTSFALYQTINAESFMTLMAHIRLRHGPQHAPTNLTRPRALPTSRSPRPHLMPLQRRTPGPLQLADQVAHERRMPLVRVAGNEVIGLLERKQIQHQAAHGRALANAVVQDMCVARRGHAVGAFGERGHAVD